MASVKLVVDIDPQLASGAQQKIVDQIQSGLSSVPFDIDTSAALKKVDEVAATLEKSSAAVTVQVDADTSAAEKSVRDATGKFVKKTTIEVDADASKAKSEVDSITKSESVTIDVDADPSAVRDLAQSFDRAKSDLEALEKTQRSALAALRLTGKEGTAEYQKLSAQLDKTRSQLDDISKASSVDIKLQPQEGLLGSVKNEIGNLFGSGGSITGLFGAGLSGMLTAGVGVAIAGIGAAFANGKEIDNALKDLSAVTGATTTELAKLEGAAKQAFLGGVGESVSEAIAIIGKAEVALGDVFSAEEVGQFTAQASALGRVFDKDVFEVIQKTTPAIKQFGLSAEEAANFTSLALSAGTTASDDTLDTIAEYSGVFQKSGFSALQFADALRTVGEAGAFTTDKVGDAVKEAQIRLDAGDIAKGLGEIAVGGDKAAASLAKQSDALFAQARAGNITLQEALVKSNEIINKSFQAGEISDSIRSQLQVAIAGTPAEDLGTDLYAKIFTVKSDAELQKQAQDAGKRFSNLIGQYSSFDAVTRNLELVFAEVSQFVFKLADVFAPFAGALIEVFNGIGPIISEVGERINFFGGEVSSVLTDTLGTAVQVLVQAFEFLFNASTVFAVGVINAIGPVFERVGEYVGSISELFGSGGSLSEAFSQAADIFGDFAEILSGVVTDAIVAVVDVLFDFSEVIVTGVVSAFKLFGNILVSVGEFFGVFADEAESSAAATENLSGSAQSATGFIGLLKTAVEGIGSAFAVARGAVAAVTSAIGAIADVIKTAISALSSGNFQDAVSAFFGIGEKVGSAFTSGYENKTGSIALDKFIKQNEDLLGNIADGFEQVAREANKIPNAAARTARFESDLNKVYGERSSQLSGLRRQLGDLRAQGKISADQEAAGLAKIQAAESELNKSRDDARKKFTESSNAATAAGNRAVQQNEVIAKSQSDAAKARAEAAKNADAAALAALEKSKSEVALANQRVNRDRETERLRKNIGKTAADELVEAQGLLSVLEQQKKLIESAGTQVKTDDAKKQLAADLEDIALQIEEQQTVVVRTEIAVDQAAAEANKKLAGIRLSRLQLAVELGTGSVDSLRTELESQIAELQKQLASAEAALDVAVGADVEPAFNAVSDLYSRLQKLKSEYDKSVEASTAASYKRQLALGDQYTLSYAQILEKEKDLKKKSADALAAGDEKTYAESEGKLRAYTDTKAKIEEGAAALSIDLTTEASDTSLSAIETQIDLQKQFGETFLAFGNAFGETFANLLTGAENAASSLVSVVFDALDALIPILSAQIFGVMVASPNPANALSLGATGVVAATALTGALKALLAAARAALGRRTGEFNIGGDKYAVDASGKFGIATGDYSHGRDRILRFHEPGETIFSRQHTQKNYRLFKYIAETGRSWQDFPEAKKILEFTPAAAYIDNAALLDDRRIVAAIEALGDRMAKAPAQPRTQVDVRFKGRGVKSLIEAEQYNQYLRM